jgi:fido (protein-threonine AMPylation protein)
MNMNDFEEYIRQGEPDRVEKSKNWQTAIGLQQVDGLRPSGYLIETAKHNIEGDITFDEVKSRLDTYYRTQSAREDDRTEEADKVSARIAEVLSEETFSFSPTEYINIHRRLFNGIYKFAGKIRDYNISKSEWVLKGKSVMYSNAEIIRATLEYDFQQEKQFDYQGVNMMQSIEHIAKFISGIWQIHAFGEGNTRTTAVFAIKYLRSFGFEIDNSLFAEHSWYFRNTLVRANYTDMRNEVFATTEYLMRFFGNLLLGEQNTLRNRELLIGAHGFQSAKMSENTISKSNICTLDCTLEEHVVLEYLKVNPRATQKEIAIQIRKSERTVKTITASLQQKGLLKRLNGKRNGYWSVTNNL